MPAGAGRSRTYYSQGMAALPPRPARRRPRLGSLERPVSGRLYRGTWLLVGIPLLLAAFSVRKAEPLPSPSPALPAAFDRSGAMELASQLAATYPDRVPGTAGAAGAATVVRAAARALRAEGLRRPLSRAPARARPPAARQPNRDHPREAARRDRRDGAPRRQRRRARRERQRIRDRRAHPACALVRDAGRRARGPRAQPAAHPRLRRHRRRRVRSPRRPAPRADPSRPRPGGDRPRLARRPRPRAARPRGVAAPARVTGLRRDGVSARPAADGLPAPAADRLRPAPRSRLSVHAARPGAAPCPRNTRRSR